MDNIQKCECVVGMRHGYENTELVTLNELKKHIKNRTDFAKSWKFEVTVYTLADYCDRRKSTDLTRFNYCPICGKKIDWKSIKGGANG